MTNCCINTIVNVNSFTYILKTDNHRFFSVTQHVDADTGETLAVSTVDADLARQSVITDHHRDADSDFAHKELATARNLGYKLVARDFRTLEVDTSLDSLHVQLSPEVS